MTESMARPAFALYVAWHPDYVRGAAIAERLLHHFRSHRCRDIVGGAGVSVLFRSANAPGLETPLSIEWGDAEVTAVVVLIDDMLVGDPEWVRYVQTLVSEAAAGRSGARVFPVKMEPGVLGMDLDVQAVLWDRWAGSDAAKKQRLIRDLTYEFIRMLRHHLGSLQHSEDPDVFKNRLKNISVFLSHSKHDEYGETVAESIREWLYRNSLVKNFLDVYDIPAGLSFTSVIDHFINVGALLTIYTDSYSSRPWCHYEVITAKRNNIPMLVVDCLEGIDGRALPYLGNVPVIRMDPNLMDRVEQIAGLLLEEVFKHFLWRCRVERMRWSHPQIIFLARPPELISLAALPRSESEGNRVIVYPDPPLGAEETRLLLDAGVDVCLFSLTQWQGEAGA